MNPVILHSFFGGRRQLRSPQAAGGPAFVLVIAMLVITRLPRGTQRRYQDCVP
jgi:hypothetical protein